MAVPGSRLLARLIGWAHSRPADIPVVWASHRSIGYHQRVGFQPSREAMDLAVSSRHS
jgi:hypothetical protein